MPPAKGKKAGGVGTARRSTNTAAAVATADFEDYFAKIYGPARWAELRAACAERSGKVALLNKFVRDVDLSTIFRRAVVDTTVAAPSNLTMANLAAATAAASAAPEKPQQQQDEQDGKKKEEETGHPEAEKHQQDKKNGEGDDDKAAAAAAAEAAPQDDPSAPPAKKPKPPVHICRLESSGLRYVAKHDGRGSTGFPSMPRHETTGDPIYYLLDLASLVVVDALRPDPWSKCADIAAAPGGKSVAIGQIIAQPGELVANELDSRRRERLHSVLQLYLGNGTNGLVPWKMTARDGRNWHQPNYFDRVLLDAPCSSERHLIEDSTTHTWSLPRAVETAKTQSEMLLRSFETAASGGRIVYSTCSINPMENDGVVTLSLGKTRCNVEVDKTFAGPPMEGFETTPCGGFMIMPDRCRGAGPIFICVFRKKDDSLLSGGSSKTGVMAGCSDDDDDDDAGTAPAKRRSGNNSNKKNNKKNFSDSRSQSDSDLYECDEDSGPVYDQVTGKRKKKVQPEDQEAFERNSRREAAARGQAGAAFWNAN